MKTEKKNRKRKSSIKSKIIFLAVIVSFVPLLLSNVISSAISMRAGREDAYEEIQDRTQSISAQVEEYVNKAYAVIEALSYSEDILSRNPKKQQDIFIQTIKNNPYFLLLYEQGLDGMQTARNEGECGYRGDRWWFTKEMEEQKPYVSKSYFSLTGGVAVTSIVFPVWGPDQKMVEILASDLNLNKLQEIIDGYNTADTYSVLIDGEGSVIAHPDQEQIAQLYNYKNGTKSVTENDETKEYPIDITADLKNLTARLLSGESGVEEFNTATGEPAIYSYSPIHLPGNSEEWGVITIQMKNAAYASTYSMIKSNLLLTLVLAVVIILTALLFTRRMVNPLRHLTKAANQIADGDLNVDVFVASNDEIGAVSEALGKTVDRLKSYIDYINEITEILNKISNGILHFELKYDYIGEFSSIKEALLNIRRTLSNTMSDIREVAEQVKENAAQLSGGSDTLAEGTTKQASAVEELSSTIQSVTDKVSENAEHTKTANEQIELIGEKINLSNEQMQNMLTAMNEIQSRSQEIGKVIKTIEDIAFQTNILALNAAVEAARSGEAGKGFAVVADEVRSLANKSSEAAKDSSHLIEDSVEAVNKGSVLADHAAENLQSIDQASRQIVTTISEISIASQEQAEAISQISQGLGQIEAVVSSSAATAEETAASSKLLTDQAGMLHEMVGKFKLDDTE